MKSIFIRDLLQRLANEGKVKENISAGKICGLWRKRREI